jgi:hypothetical protein
MKQEWAENIPGLANVQDVDTILTGLPQVRLHVSLQVLAAEVALSRQEHLDVLGGGIEDRGEVGGSHGGRYLSFFFDREVAGGVKKERKWEECGKKFTRLHYTMRTHTLAGPTGSLKWDEFGKSVR